MAMFFPQLLSGASGQFPLRRMLQFRTVLEEGNRVSTARSIDDGIQRAEWRIQLRGLSDAEMESLVSLYRHSRGVHGSFVYCDPEDNLLVYSEDLTHTRWNKSTSATVQEAPTHAVPTGAGWRVQATGTSGEVWQHVVLPTEYQWVVSLYGRSDTAADLMLLQRSSHGERQHVVTLTSDWKRYWFRGSGWPAGEGMDVGIRLGAGKQADVTGFQLEGQASPSVYKKTTASCGVYPEARFADERLRITSISNHCHQMNLRVVAQLQR